MQVCKLQPTGPLTTERIERAEAALLQQPQADCPLTHRLYPNLCIREVKMPAGALVIGHAHRFADVNIMLTGRLTLLMDDGSLKELTAPQTFLGSPGRKIAYIHEDVIWQNVWVLADGHQFNGDIEAIEQHFLDKSPTWTADQKQRQAMDRIARQSDRESFAAFLAEHELDPEDVRRISECMADQIPMSHGEYKFQVGDSAIADKGLIATSPIAAGEVIGPARIKGKRTLIGRYANHAAEPNAQMVATPTGDFELVAVREIRGCAGGQPGEEITVNYKQVLIANCRSVINNVTKGKLLCQP